MATVKVSDQTYRKLNELAGKLRSRLGRPVSVQEALDLAMRQGKPKPADYSGSWLMTDEEGKEIERGLKKGWRRWKLPRE
ncbi:MAG: hypothetical protein ACRECH_01795 [Nitrososphaerales archaeon]